MKQQKGTLVIILALILGSLQLKAQQITPTDPLLKFKRFTEVGLVISGSRVNTNYTQFKTPKGVFNFEKNTYLPAIDAHFNYGRLLKNKDGNTIRTFKTGLNLTSRKANLLDSDSTMWRHSTTFLQIPFQYGLRFPQRFNTVKNDLYRSFEINFGFYLSIPMFEKLDHPDNVDSGGDFILLSNLRVGFISELVYTALDSKGHGHKFGIRTGIDFIHINEIIDTPSKLYPVYSTIGVFYNIANRYR